jgi:hypothetical protein
MAIYTIATLIVVIASMAGAIARLWRRQMNIDRGTTASLKHPNKFTNA